MIKLSPSKIEEHVVNSLKPVGKGFEYRPIAIQAEDATQFEALPDEMMTSIYL